MDCEDSLKRLARCPVSIYQSNPPELPFAAIVVAAGKGTRSGQVVPKQFAPWRGKPVVRHSIDALREAGCPHIVIVAPAGMHQMARDAAGATEGLVVIDGGATRQQSVAAGLEALADHGFERVLIHDAARPDLPGEVIRRLLSGLESRAGAIPVLPVVDSIIVADGERMAADARRETLRRVQTPQAFRFTEILAAHRAWPGEPVAGDDAQVLRAAGGEVALVDGDERLKKLTFAEDFVTETAPALPVRVGMGYDVHRLAAGEELWLCGLQVPHDKGLAGHSDADVGLHAVVDAILGAMAMGDIGQHFPPSDPQWEGARSAQFVEHAVKLAGDAGYVVGNVDLTLICEAPKIGPHREAMQARLAELLATAAGSVSVKATTTEKLGFTGRGEGIAAQAVATMVART